MLTMKKRAATFEDGLSQFVTILPILGSTKRMGMGTAGSNQRPRESGAGHAQRHGAIANGFFSLL
jgi:hypothetical protein